ncbi:MAG: ATP-binding protein [Clostridium sp.]|nr:ATP-binding protein [Clostridium sp.]
MAHGPVLIKGGRGTGKSALLREADNRLRNSNVACGIYLSLRHLPLLRTQGEQYEKEFIRILSDRIQEVSMNQYEYEFACETDIYSLQQELNRFSERIEKRIVLFFDDAAHIGREAGLEEFFDIFRTLSSYRISCKAAIYPGVTRFGTRFDVYNDAKVIDITRKYGQMDFEEFFYQVMVLRFEKNIRKEMFSESINPKRMATFLGMAVLGNVRSFIRGCSLLFEDEKKVTFQKLSDVFTRLASDFFWPMMEEVKPKLGVYESFIDSCEKLAELIYRECGGKTATSFIIHRNLVNKYSKVLEILEYVGFISKREASRGMKSGGRGTRYAVNLCNTLEWVNTSRITNDLYDKWINSRVEDVQFQMNSTKINSIEIPEKRESNGIEMLSLEISKLKKSKAVPYGLSNQKIELLESNEILTIGDLAEYTKDQLMELPSIGEVMAERIRNVVEQAIWM